MDSLPCPSLDINLLRTEFWWIRTSSLKRADGETVVRYMVIKTK